MARESRAPFRSPLRAGRRRSVARGESAGSCTGRLGGGVFILLFGLRLLLLTPATEFNVPPNDHLQRGVYDMVRRTLDEGGVLLDGNCDRFLQLVFPLYHFRRLVND